MKSSKTFKKLKCSPNRKNLIIKIDLLVLQMKIFFYLKQFGIKIAIIKL